jgi:hypothetical protein
MLLKLWISIKPCIVNLVTSKRFEDSHIASRFHEFWNEELACENLEMI